MVAAALAHPARAPAAELWTTVDERSALEAHAFYKVLGTGLRMPRGLVEGSEALVALQASETALPRYGGLSLHTARGWGRLLLRERLELQAGWQLGMLVASDPALVGTATLGGTLTAADSGHASRRLVDFHGVLVKRGGFLLQHNLDLLALKLRTSYADVIVGRQVLSWGSGRLWNPTDLLSPFGPADLDREVRRGVDAVRISIPLAATAQLELLWLPQPEPGDHGGVARGQVNVGGFDVAPSIAKYARDVVLGLDAAGDVGSLGVHGELAWTRALDAQPEGVRAEFFRGVLGIDVRPVEKLVLTGEYYFNGWGAARPAGYVEVLGSARVTRGEVFGAGRHYLGLVAAVQASELLSVQAVALTNLGDPSMLLVPALEYWAEQSVLVRLNGSIPVGRRPDSSALQALTADDVTSQTDAWREATRSLGLRSEFGSSPWGVYAQVAVYFL